MPFAGEMSGPGNATNTGFAGAPFAGQPFAGAPFAGQVIPVGLRILGPLGLVLILLAPLGGYTRDEVAAIERFQADGTPPPFGQIEETGETP